MKKIALLFWIFSLLQGITSAQQTVGLFTNSSESYNGYTLFAPMNDKVTYLIDNCGEMINSWESDFLPGASAYLLENGNLLRTARIPSNFQAGGVGGRLEIFNWEGDIIWGYDYSGDDQLQHHDVAYMPNGNILILSYDVRTANEMIESGRDPNNIPADKIWNEKIVEIKPIGADSITVVWEWFLFDHLIQDIDPTKNNFGVVAEHPELLDINSGLPVFPLSGIDWIHFNSINYNPQLDQILIGSPYLHELLIIDHSTTTTEAAGHIGGTADKGGDFLYRWGNPSNYKRGFNSDRKFFGQHDAQWIEEGLPDAGKIMIYNNGFARPGGVFSSIEIINPQMDNDGNYIIEDGEPYGPDNVFWTYSANPMNSFYSKNISGANRLPNGNTLICEGNEGRIFEINNAGDIVWQYINPVSLSGIASQGSFIANNPVFRAYRYPTDFPAFEGRDLTSMGAIELNPLASNCMITDIDLAEFSNEITILKNPIQHIFSMENKNAEPLQIDVFDLMGRLVDSWQSSDQRVEQDVSAWNNGIYFIRIFIVEKNVFFTKKVKKQE